MVQTTAVERPLGVLMVLQRFPPELGGAEQQAARLSAALRRRGVRVEVLTLPHPSRPLEGLDAFGTPVHCVGAWAPPRVRTLGFALSAAHQLLKRAAEFDVVHFHLLNSHALLGAPVGHLLRYGVVVKGAGVGTTSDAMRQLQHPLGKHYLPVLMRCVDAFIALNPLAVEEWQLAGARLEQVAVLQNGLDLSHYPLTTPQLRAEAREKWGRRGPVVVFVGAYRPVKLLPVLIEGFRRALRQHPDATLVLAGDGEQRPQLEAQVAQAGIHEHVVFTGSLTPEQVREQLNAADVFALVSENEGISNALLEAMAVGLPALVTDVPGNKELVQPDVQGLRIPPNQPDAIAEALHRLFSDEALRHRLGMAGRQLVETRFSMEGVAALYESLYLRIRSRGQRASARATARATAPASR